MDVELLGNTKLLTMPKTAFLASGDIAPDMVLTCYDWAVRMTEEDRCVISGFSSHIERDVLHFLAKGLQPIIMVIARKMYKQIPSELQTLLDANRLLIISTSTSPRQSRITAQVRNRYICDVADNILFVCNSETSSLYELQQEYHHKRIYIENFR